MLDKFFSKYEGGVKLNPPLPRKNYPQKPSLIRVKNGTCYYFDDIIKLEDFNFDNILIDEKSHENILIYDISYKTLIGPRPLRIRFDKINGFIRIYDVPRYLVSLGPEKKKMLFIIELDIL